MSRRVVALISLASLWCFPASRAAAACGGAWNELPSPAAHFSEAVAAVAVDDAWLAAWDANRFGEDQSYVYRWNGDTWSRVAIPEPGVTEYVRGIGTIATDDVWIVGTWQENITYKGHLYAAHWDGSEFTQTPLEGGRYARVFAVDGVAPDDLWTVGYHFVDHKYRSLAMHWDGISWTEVPTPMPAASRNLYAVHAIASDDVWAVGASMTRGGGRRALALHWDGVGWTSVPPRTSSTTSTFSGVTSTAPNRVWAVGNVDNGRDTLIQRWNGTAWMDFPVPRVDASFVSLEDVSAVSDDQAWAVGSAGGEPLMFRWNGTSWRSAAVPSTPGDAYLSEVDSLPSGTSFAVGTASRSDILALQRCPVA